MGRDDQSAATLERHGALPAQREARFNRHPMAKARLARNARWSGGRPGVPHKKNLRTYLRNYELEEDRYDEDDLFFFNFPE